MRNSTYFNKLMKIIDGEGYECLMKKLYSIPFYSDIALDKNLIDKVIAYVVWRHREVKRTCIAAFNCSTPAPPTALVCRHL